MDFSPLGWVLIALLLAAWTAAAGWALLTSVRRTRQAASARTAVRKMARLIDEAPAIPLLVRADGRLEAPERLARWLGLERVPQFLADLAPGEGQGLAAEQLAELEGKVRAAQKTGASFRMALTPPGSRRSLALRGSLADPQISPGGAALVWVFDFSESESELAQLRGSEARARTDYAALVGLIEAAPIPMWVRGADHRLLLVNQAYASAVDAPGTDEVIARQIELIERTDGLTAAQIAEHAAAQQMAVERIVGATIGGERRTLRVSDVPIPGVGVAGYAIDIAELEEERRAARAFREAQRQLLDQISPGVAQFDAGQRLVHANQPFRRIFGLGPEVALHDTGFGRLLGAARDAGKTPEVRDFPAWRAEREGWFSAGEPQEEIWTLAGGIHVRLVAQPMPDGGLVLIAEDRTEQLALSAMRDTLLRTRTATFDSLFEALAVFAPDGHLQQWNRSFAPAWGLDPALLDAHPGADALTAALAPLLADEAQAPAIGEVVRAATLDRKETAGRVRLADGRTLEYAGVPLPDGNGLLTVLDVTANERAESALRERAAALEAADEVKTRFLANMSYELRTPLTTIGGFAEMLQAGIAGELSAQGQDYVAAIIAAVARLTDQVENVLDVSQGEAGLLPVSRQRIELLPFVTDIVRSREQAIVDGGLALDLRGGAGARLDADPRQLGRALGHLLDNAIAATAPGGKILVDLAKPKGVVRIVVSDNGAGMTREELSRANDGLRRAPDGSLERRHGLGIPLARQLVEAHGGTLEIVSEKGAGTFATILLPPVS